MTGLEFSTVAYINKRIDIVNTGGKKKKKKKTILKIESLWIPVTTSNWNHLGKFPFHFLITNWKINLWTVDINHINTFDFIYLFFLVLPSQKEKQNIQWNSNNLQINILISFVHGQPCQNMFLLLTFFFFT